MARLASIDGPARAARSCVDGPSTTRLRSFGGEARNCQRRHSDPSARRPRFVDEKNPIRRRRDSPPSTRSVRRPPSGARGSRSRGGAPIQRLDDASPPTGQSVCVGYQIEARTVDDTTQDPSMTRSESCTIRLGAIHDEAQVHRRRGSDLSTATVRCIHEQTRFVDKKKPIRPRQNSDPPTTRLRSAHEECPTSPPSVARGSKKFGAAPARRLDDTCTPTGRSTPSPDEPAAIRTNGSRLIERRALD